MEIALIVVQIIASVALIGLILIQQGKGADAGASFGAGASQTFFGSAGSANAVTKLTALFATIFFVACLALAYVAREEDRTGLQKELSRQLAPAAVPATGDTANTGLAPKAQTAPAVESDIAPTSPVEKAVVNEAVMEEEAAAEETPDLEEAAQEPSPEQNQNQ